MSWLHEQIHEKAAGKELQSLPDNHMGGTAQNPLTIQYIYHQIGCGQHGDETGIPAQIVRPSCPEEQTDQAEQSYSALKRLQLPSRKCQKKQIQQSNTHHEGVQVINHELLSADATFVSQKLCYALMIIYRSICHKKPPEKPDYKRYAPEDALLVP